MAAFSNFSAEGSALQKSRTSEGPISALQVSLVPVKRWSWHCVVGEFFVVDAGNFDVDVDTVEEAEQLHSLMGGPK